MATTTVTSIRHINVLEGDHAPFPGESTTSVILALVYFDTEQQAAAGGDTISLNLATAIQNVRRNGKTVTIRSATMARPARNSTTNASVAYKTVALSAPTLTFIPTTSDYSTNLAVGATDNLTIRSWSAFVAFTEA